MRKETKSVAYDMGLTPISLWTAIKLMLKGYKPGLCIGIKRGKGIRAKLWM